MDEFDYEVSHGLWTDILKYEPTLIHFDLEDAEALERVEDGNKSTQAMAESNQEGKVDWVGIYVSMEAVMSSVGLDVNDVPSGHSPSPRNNLTTLFRLLGSPSGGKPKVEYVLHL